MNLSIYLEETMTEYGRRCPKLTLHHHVNTATRLGSKRLESVSTWTQMFFLLLVTNLSNYCSPVRYRRWSWERRILYWWMSDDTMDRQAAYKFGDYGPNTTTLAWLRSQYQSMMQAMQPPSPLHGEHNSSDSSGVCGLESSPSKDALRSLGLQLQECSLRPGQIIYFPAMWPHATLNTDGYNDFVSVFIDTQLMRDWCIHSFILTHLPRWHINIFYTICCFTAYVIHILLCNTQALWRYNKGKCFHNCNIFIFVTCWRNKLRCWFIMNPLFEITADRGLACVSSQVNNSTEKISYILWSIYISIIFYYNTSVR